MVKSSLEVVIEHAGWRRVRGLEARLDKVALATLAHLPARYRFPCSLTLLLTDNKALRRLNRDFRGLDKATNVLSFPQYEPPELGKFKGSRKAVELGDIAIGYQYVVAESNKDHKVLINHISHLLIHGILHLFGYDHVLEDEAQLMERLERTIMAELGYPDPYALPRPKKRQKPARPQPKKHQ